MKSRGGYILVLVALTYLVSFYWRSLPNLELQQNGQRYGNITTDDV